MRKTVLLGGWFIIALGWSIALSIVYFICGWSIVEVCKGNFIYVLGVIPGLVYFIYILWMRNMRKRLDAYDPKVQWLVSTLMAGAKILHAQNGQIILEWNSKLQSKKEVVHLGFKEMDKDVEHPCFECYKLSPDEIQNILPYCIFIVEPEEGVIQVVFREEDRKSCEFAIIMAGVTAYQVTKKVKVAR